MVGASGGRGDEGYAEDAAAGPVYRSSLSPLDRRVDSFVAVMSATLRAAGRRASAHMTTPLPSQDSTGTSPRSPDRCP